MTAVSFTNRRLFKMRRDKQVAAANFQVDNGPKATLIATSSSAGDSSDKVLKAGDTMTGELIAPLITVEELNTDEINESTADAGVTIEGVELKDGALNIDAIGELTAGAGVTVDGVLLKDGEVTTDEINEDTAGAGVTIDGLQLKDGAVMLPDSQSIFFGDASNGIQLYSNGSYVIFGRYGTTALPIYIQPEIPTFYNYAAISYHGAASGDLQSFRGNNLTGDDWSITGSSGTLKNNLIQSFTTAFVSGFTGTGFQLGVDSEVQNLIVRGAMKVYELIINKIRATNGSLWVTDAVKALTDMSYDGSRWYFDVEDNSNTLMADDIIKAQAFDGNDVYSIVLKVYSVTSTRVTCVTEADGAVATDDRATENKDFVRIGNTSDVNRQGAIYITSSDENSPYMEVLSGMDSSTIAAENRKVRLGKLDGMSYDGESIGGYGLWSEDAFLQGTVNAIAGYIANWIISGDQISSETAAGQFVMDSSDLSITIKNAADVTKFRLSPESIPDLADIQAAANTTFIGGYATSSSDVTQVFASSGTDDDTYYLQETTGSASYLDALTTKPTTTYQIPVTANLNYNTILKWSSRPDYTVPTDDLDPSPGGVTKQYELVGTYQQDFTVKAYDSADTLLATQITRRTAKVADDVSITIFNKTIKPTTAYVYFTVQVETADNLSTQVTEKRYSWDGVVWSYLYTTVYSQALAVDMDMEVAELTLNGTYNQVQIGENGLSHYTSSTKYFMLNEDEAAYIQSQGIWEHLKGAVTFGDPANTSNFGSLTINHARDGVISSPLTAYPLNINSNNDSYCVGIFNDGNANSHNGILMRLGPDTHGATDVLYINAGDGNGTQVGALLSDSTSFRVYSVSDRRLKENIKAISGKEALELIMKLKPKHFTMKRNAGADNNPVQAGYIAQEVQKVLPSAVKKADDSDYLMMSDAGFNPYLLRAFQELSKEHEALKKKYTDMDKRLKVIESKLK